MRFVRGGGGGGSKVFSRDQVGPEESPALFLGRLWALFGPADPSDGGFSYRLRDQDTNVDFQAYCGPSGPAYGATTTQIRWPNWPNCSTCTICTSASSTRKP